MSGGDSYQPAPGSRRDAGSAGRSKWVILPLLIFAGIAGAFTYALHTADPSKLPSALLNKTVPRVTFEPLDFQGGSGKVFKGFSAADLSNGQVTVVNFWASWCRPCAFELPLLTKLQKETGVQMFSVNYKDQPEAALRFLEEYGNPFAAVGIDPKGRGSIEWGVYGMPETFVVAGDGRIAYKHIGEITEDSLRSKLMPAIEAAKKAPLEGSKP